MLAHAPARLIQNGQALRSIGLTLIWRRALGKPLSIEEGEARLERYVEVKALALGLLAGVAASFIVTLAIPVQVRVQQGFVDLFIAEGHFGPIQADRYYLTLGLVAVVVIGVALSAAKRVYGLTKPLEVRLDHSEDRSALGTRLMKQFEAFGILHGLRTTQGTTQADGALTQLQISIFLEENKNGS
jgi:hypothetical protein